MAISTNTICDHARAVTLSRDGLIVIGGVKKRGRIEWCPDCGGIRGSTVSQHGVWYLAGTEKVIGLALEADRLGDIHPIYPPEGDRQEIVPGEDS